MALLLRRRGIERIRPLAGGLDAWSDRGYPLERREPLPEDPGRAEPYMPAGR